MFRLFICPKIEQFEHLKFTRYSIYLKENNDQRDTAGLGESLNWGMEHVFAWGGEKNSGLLKGGNRLLFKTVSSLWSFTNPIGLYVHASATHIVVECIRVCQCLLQVDPITLHVCVCVYTYACPYVCVSRRRHLAMYSFGTFDVGGWMELGCFGHFQTALSSRWIRQSKAF